MIVKNAYLLLGALGIAGVIALAVITMKNSERDNVEEATNGSLKLTAEASNSGEGLGRNGFTVSDDEITSTFTGRTMASVSDSQTSVSDAEGTDRGNSSTEFKMVAYLEERGYHHPEAKSDYEGYTIEQLQVLAEQEDVQAISVLAKRLALEGRDDEAYSWNLKAAIYGLSAHLVAIGDYHRTQYQYSSIDADTAHLEGLKAMGAYKAAYYLQDPMAASSAKAFYETSDLQLTQNDLAAIDTKARELYGYLQKEREKSDLAPISEEQSNLFAEHYSSNFSVNTPSGPKRFFDELKN